MIIQDVLNIIVIGSFVCILRANLCVLFWTTASVLAGLFLSVQYHIAMSRE